MKTDTEQKDTPKAHDKVVDVDLWVTHSSMIYNNYGRKKYHAICTGDNCNVNSSDLIPSYYSLQHANDDGWNYTKDILFCPPDVDGVWVCPNCSVGYF